MNDPTRPSKAQERARANYYNTIAAQRKSVRERFKPGDRVRIADAASASHWGEWCTFLRMELILDKHWRVFLESETRGKFDWAMSTFATQVDMGEYE